MLPSIFDRKASLLDSSFEKMFQDFFGDFGNSYDRLNKFDTDIIDKGDSYLLQAELPGFDKEDIHIDLNNDILTISASHREEKSEGNEKDGSYIRRERRYSSYSRSFQIPDINAEDIEAAYNNGILEVSFPKKQISVNEPKKIEVK